MTGGVELNHSLSLQLPQVSFKAIRWMPFNKSLDLPRSKCLKSCSILLDVPDTILQHIGMGRL